MLEIKVGNSFSKISNIDTITYAKLREELSYKIDPQQTFFGGSPRAAKRYLLNKRGEFPSGLLSRVYRFLRSHTYRVIETSPVPLQGALFKLMLPKGIHIREEQHEAATSAQTKNRGIIRAPTGAGKSMIMALLIEKLQVPTLVIVPTLALKIQLQQTFKELFGSLNNITVENIASTALKTATNYGCLIIDEAHHAAAATYRDLNKRAWQGIYYRFFFTATPFRTKSEEQLLMESITGEVIYELSHKTAVEKGYIVPVEAYCVDVPTDKKVACTHWRTVYNELIVNNSSRNDIIIKLIKVLQDTGASVLCLVREIAHGEFLAKETGVPFANGQDGLVRQRILEFNLREEKILIGTAQVLGEGIDTRPAEYIILAGGGKSKNEFMQNIGRGFRTYEGKDSCKVIFLRDKSHKFLTRHFAQLMRHLKEEYGICPAKLEIF